MRDKVKNKHQASLDRVKKYDLIERSDSREKVKARMAHKPYCTDWRKDGRA